MEADFEAAFIASDVNKTNAIDADEYSDFVDRTYENRKKRYGNAIKEDEES